MNFLSVEFLIFFLVLLTCLAVLKRKEVQQVILLIASYVFYVNSSIKFAVLLFVISLIMWLLGKQIEKNSGNRKAKLFLAVGVIADLFVLGYFKYFNFFIENFAKVFQLEYSVMNIMLPLGISFYIFQSISYIADVYLGKISAEKSLIRVMLYIAFFPQITSGPIVKAHKFFCQLDERHAIVKENIYWGMQRFVLGAFKKVVIADRLGRCVDAVYSAPAAYSSVSLIMAIISYSLQIYYDFSGYSDMAIGVAHVLGFDLGSNFNLPYLAKNPSDFWRRWHISLSSWFRDYVYIPLGGSRKGKLRTYLNLFITMLLSGLWHGASWAFVVWGALHALFSTMHKIFADITKKNNIQIQNGTMKKIISFLSVIVTYIVVSILWVPFRTNDIVQAIDIIKLVLANNTGAFYVYTYTVIFAIGLIIIELISMKKNNGNDIWIPLNLDKLWCKVIFCTFVIFTVVFAYIGDSAFIYAQF